MSNNIIERETYSTAHVPFNVISFFFKKSSDQYTQLFIFAQVEIGGGRVGNEKTRFPIVIIFFYFLLSFLAFGMLYWKQQQLSNSFLYP